MKKILKLIPIIMAAIAVFAVSAFGWLAGYSVVKFPTNFGGSMKTEYFAGGDGSKDYPYIISSPVHFYNLAWLQYLGYFNLGEYINNGRAQSFFKLDFDGANLNLQGLALPPIGTREYPFIGNFDGNGKTISNFTVSNSKTDLVKRPLAAVFSGDYLNTTRRRSSEIVDILGLFGVTGDFKSSLEGVYADKEVAVKTDTSTETKAVSIHKKVDGGSSLESLPSDNVAENEFYYSGMDVHSFYIDKIKVHSVAENALIGLAAGYVGSTIENVGVYRSKVTVSGNTISGATGIKKSSGADVSYDGVISNYSIVGDYDDEIVGWTEAPGSGNTSGDAATWGGSIDMRTLNRRLSYMYANGNIKNNSYIYSSSSAYNTFLSYAYGNPTNYDWQAENDVYMSILDGSVLPINVDTADMGISSFENINEKTSQTVSGTAFRSNAEYIAKKDIGETILGSNTGYFVGGGSYASEAKLRSGIRKWTSSPSSGYGGYGGVVYESFKGAGKGDDITYTTEGDNAINKTFALYTLCGSGTNWTTYCIVDDVNKDNYTEGGTNKRYDSAELNFTEYKNVRKNFDSAMSGSKTLHGFHFFPYIPNGTVSGTSISTYTTKHDVSILGETMSDYELVKGSLNFTVEKQGKIATIVGTGYTATKHSLFDLYEVTRDSSSHRIKKLTQIEQIYTKKNSDGTLDIAYNNKPSDEYTLAVDIKSLSSGNDYLDKMAAYYFEMPVNAGDYVICMANGSSTHNAYLMYLDVGANGSETSGGTTKELPYIMKSVDFVSMSSDDTSDTLTVPNNQTTFPIYADVGFRLGAATDVIYFRREDYSGTVTEDAAFTTVVNYWRENAVIAVTVTPTIFGAEDNKAKWED